MYTIEPHHWPLMNNAARAGGSFKYELDGIKLEPAGRAIATNGRSLTIMAIAADYGARELIVPIEAWGNAWEMWKLMGGTASPGGVSHGTPGPSNGVVRVAHAGDERGYLSGAGWTIEFVPATRYPDWRKVVPVKFPIVARTLVSCELLIHLLKQHQRTSDDGIARLSIVDHNGVFKRLVNSPYGCPAASVLMPVSREHFHEWGDVTASLVA